HNWINSPGRLQTVMLAMGDRHYSTNPIAQAVTVQNTTRGDVLYGFGRPTLRRFVVGLESRNGWYQITWYTNTSTKTFDLFGKPPAGVRQVKCFLHQHEDLSGVTSSIANFDLRVRVVEPLASGTCDSSGDQVISREDTSYDAKSMVAIEDNY